MEDLDTRWSKEAAETDEWSYPRPMMMRREWICLNGEWDYLITDKRVIPAEVFDCGFEDFPFDGKIRVPFSPEAPLSGVEQQLLPDETLWYARRITLPYGYFMPGRDRLLLHFGAVDQICSVYINGRQAGFHKGGYLPFTLDITYFANRGPEFAILIAVHDFSDLSYHSRGKQKILPKGMYYTAQSGIWQTVWMEKVPVDSMESVRLTPDFDAGKVAVRVKVHRPEAKQSASMDSTAKNPDAAQSQFLESGNLQFRNADDSSSQSTAQSSESENSWLKKSADSEHAATDILCQIYAPCRLSARGPVEDFCKTLLAETRIQPGKEASIAVPEQKPWTPETPWLYPVKLTYGWDIVYTYFALRKCDIQKDKNGTPRLFLNNQPYFQAGVLDQGYWPDGLYTAPSDEAFIYDIQSMKKMGFNMLRKHAKIEADRWYFHCDRLGMLVWQDMVNGGTPYKDWFVTYLANLLNYLQIPVSDRHPKLLSRLEYDGRQEFLQEVRDTVKALYNHPSIVCWIPFNEGWGQFSTEKVTKMIASLDSRRLIDSASGWFDQGCGDFRSIHYYYFGLPMPRKKESRAIVLSEFGGLACPVPHHCASEQVYGYQTFRGPKRLAAGYRKLVESTVLPRIPEGISATIYTQLSDIEEEVNGLLTYDRKVTKLPPNFVRKINEQLKAANVKSSSARDDTVRTNKKDSASR